MPAPEDIPFSEFGKPEKIKKINGVLSFDNDLSGFQGKKVYQYVFFYWVSDDSIISSGKKNRKNLSKWKSFAEKGSVQAEYI